MNGWQETLAYLGGQGWACEVSSFFDCGAGKNIFVIEASRGGATVRGRGQSLPEAGLSLRAALQTAGFGIGREEDGNGPNL